MTLAMSESGAGTCTHGGTLTLTGKGVTPLKAGTKKIITKTSIIGASVVGCPFQSPPPTPAPCTVVASASGESSSLKSGSIGALLTSSSLVITNPVVGPVSGSFSSAGQSTLNG